MNKELKALQEELKQIAAFLRIESLYDEPSGYLLNIGSPVSDLLLESSVIEREFILHKLAPELVVEDVYEGNHIILNLKK